MRERKTCYDVAAAFIRRQMEYQKQLPKRPVAAPAPEETLERLNYKIERYEIAARTGVLSWDTEDGSCTLPHTDD